jgi:PST family polysaccharide transporter
MSVARAHEPETRRYRAVLKTTSVVGGASAITIVVGMVRTKFVAVLLGPAGVGLLGVYSQLAAVVATVSGLGIPSSGVREIAAAYATESPERIGRAVLTLRRAAWVLGVAGMLGMALLSGPISTLTFGSDVHRWQVAGLSVSILFGGLSGAQSCLLRGARRIGDVARATIIGAISGTAVSVPCYFALGSEGIVVALVLVAAGGLATAWWFTRSLPIPVVDMTWRASAREARGLLTLGLGFMAASALTTATGFAVQTLLVRRFGIADAGIYQAAYSISAALVGFVLSAMAADYYPRLSAVAADDALIAREVNEQSQVAVLLALPGLSAMAFLAPIVLRILYTAHFSSAIPILVWLTVGLLGKVISWPLAFVLLAKGKGRLYVATESMAAALHVGAVWCCTRAWGLTGAGAAFAILYAGYSILMLLVVRRVVGASWTRRTMLLNVAATTMLGVISVNIVLNPQPIARWAIGGLLTAVTTVFCLTQLQRRSGLTFGDLLGRLRPNRTVG